MLHVQSEAWICDHDGRAAVTVLSLNCWDSGICLPSLGYILCVCVMGDFPTTTLGGAKDANLVYYPSPLYALFYIVANIRK